MTKNEELPSDWENCYAALPQKLRSSVEQQSRERGVLLELLKPTAVLSFMEEVRSIVFKE